MLGFGTTKAPAEQISTGAVNPAKENQPMQAQDAQMQALIDKRVDEVMNQVNKFKQIKPDFDLDKEMQNKAFAQLLWEKGLSVEDAYLLTHKEEIFNQIRSEAMSSLTSRQERIVENGAGKSTPVIAKKNPKDLTDEEIEDIMTRVQNGEKITF